MPDVVVARLAGSQVRDGSDALPDIRPRDRVDGAARAFWGVEGCRVAGAAPGGGGAAAAEPQAEAGLGRPYGDGRPGPAAPQAFADEPAGDPADATALAPAASPLALDLSPSGR